MTTSLSIHRVRRAVVTRLSPENNNAVTLKIEAENDDFEVIMFGLDADAALNFAASVAASDAVVTGPNGHDISLNEHIDFVKTIAAIEGRDV